MAGAAGSVASVASVATATREAAPAWRGAAWARRDTRLGRAVGGEDRDSRGPLSRGPAVTGEYASRVVEGDAAADAAACAARQARGLLRPAVLPECGPSAARVRPSAARVRRECCPSAARVRRECGASAARREVGETSVTRHVTGRGWASGRPLFGLVGRGWASGRTLARKGGATDRALVWASACTRARQPLTPPAGGHCV